MVTIKIRSVTSTIDRRTGHVVVIRVDGAPSRRVFGIGYRPTRIICRMKAHAVPDFKGGEYAWKQVYDAHTCWLRGPSIFAFPIREKFYSQYSLPSWAELAVAKVGKEWKPPKEE